MDINNWFHTALNNIIELGKGGISWFKKSWMVLSLSGILIGAGIYVMSLQAEQEKAKAALEVQQQAAIALQTRIDDAIKVNESNREVLSRIVEDKNTATILIDHLNDKISENNKTLFMISKKINTLEDGKLAPVLRETLRKLQEIRVDQEKTK